MTRWLRRRLLRWLIDHEPSLWGLVWTAKEVQEYPMRESAWDELMGPDGYLNEILERSGYNQPPHPSH